MDRPFTVLALHYIEGYCWQVGGFFGPRHKEAELPQKTMLCPKLDLGIEVLRWEP